MFGKCEKFSVYSAVKLTSCNQGFKKGTQPAFTCSKLTTETLEQGMKYVQS